MPMPFSSSSRPSTRTRSSRMTPSSSAAWARSANNNDTSITLKAINLEAVFQSRGAKRGARAPRGVALHVDGHRVHGDVRRRGLHMDRESGRIAAEALRADAEQVDRL